MMHAITKLLLLFIVLITFFTFLFLIRYVENLYTLAYGCWFVNLCLFMISFDHQATIYVYFYAS